MLFFLLMLASLAIILLGAELFVNGIEWLGKLFHLSEGAVGSVLAAVGTALPETLIPVIAIVFGSSKSGAEIGIGAIIGAPLMLSTLAMFVTGVAVLICRKRRKSGLKVVAHYDTLSRDLSFFLIYFALAILAGFLAAVRWLQLIIAGLLVLGYIYYVHQTLKQQREDEADAQLPRFYFAGKKQSLMESKKARPLVFLQLAVALALIIVGADLFVDSIHTLAGMWGIAPFILSLIITPIATELPEKCNSVLWISRGKDTLALGNISGAMVFQSALIPALGIFLTDWRLNSSILISACLALGSALLLFLELRAKKHISAAMLLLAGLFYAAFIVFVVVGIIF